MTERLAGFEIAILAADGFEQRELAEPRRALDGSGATTTLVSPSERWVKAWDRKNWGNEFPVDVALEQGKAEEYDAILLPGGVLSPDALRQNAKAVSFVRHFFEANKPVASICHGPELLIEADVVRGRKLTSYPSVRTDLENAGAEWFDAEVVVDGNLVTSRSPDDLEVFIEKTIDLFARAARPVRR